MIFLKTLVSVFLNNVDLMSALFQYLPGSLPQRKLLRGVSVELVLLLF